MHYSPSIFDTPSSELLNDLRTQQRAIEGAEFSLRSATGLVPSTVTGLWNSASQRCFVVALDELRGQLSTAAGQLFAAQSATARALEVGRG